MLGHVRVIIDPKGKMVNYEPDSLYYPDAQTLDFLQEVFHEGYVFDFTDSYTHDSESLVAFSIRSYQSNNYLDPIEYDFDLEIHSIIILKNDYKEHSRQTINQEFSYHQPDGPLYSDTPVIDLLVEKWEDMYDQNFYPVPLPAGYINRSADTHDPYDIYLNGL